MPQQPVESCPPVWQYVLVMADDIQASLKSIRRIGEYHYTPEDEAKMQALAEYTETVAKTLRGMVEGLTGWESD